MAEASFGRYRLVEMLGQGGMGQVFRAFDTETNREVALKVLAPQVAADEAFQERFRREAQLAARVNDPHVVPIHGFGEIDSRLFVDMRLIECRDLASVLAEGALDPVRAVRIVEQVAEALDAAHRIGLVHRDIKPSNILLGLRDFVYLIDFGIAREVDATRLTNTGAAIGTFAYMAPERFETGDSGASVDIYALACVLCECLTGSAPFGVGSMEQQISGHLTKPPPQPSAAGVPAGFDAVIAAGMAKDPAQRFSSVLALAEAARTAVGGDAAVTPVPPTLLAQTRRAPSANRPVGGYSFPPHAPETWPPKHRNRWGVIAIGITAVVAVATVTMTVIGLIFAGFIPSPFRLLHRNDEPPALAAPQDNELPFPGLGQPQGVAVDSGGNVYVTDIHSLFRLAVGSGIPTTLSYPSLFRFGRNKGGLAADAVGNVYIIDSEGVWKLAAGATDTTLLPFPELRSVGGFAVDMAGSVYVTDYDTRYAVDPQPPKVWKLQSGASEAMEIPFPVLHSPRGIAVDSSGTLYVFDIEGAYPQSTPAATVWKLVPEANAPKRIFALNSLPVQLKYGGPQCLAVDRADDLIVNLGDRVLKLAPRSTKPTTLPISVDNLQNVAVDAAGDVYITVIGHDEQTGHVLKLPAT